MYNLLLSSQKSSSDAVTTLFMMNYNSTPFTDSINGIVFTQEGSATTSSTVAIEGNSLYIPTNSYIKTATPTTFLNNIGTNDFTFETWIYMISIPTNTNGDTWPIMFTGAWAGTGEPIIVDWSVNISGSYYLLFFSWGTFDEYGVSTTIAQSLMPLNTWNHWAVTRKNGIVNFWLNGVSLNVNVSAPSSLTNTSNQETYIGHRLGGGTGNVSWLANGYLDLTRISLGARYTNNFTPPKNYH